MSGPENKSLISGFGLFCLGNTVSNLGLYKISLISVFLLYSGLTVFINFPCSVLAGFFFIYGISVCCGFFLFLFDRCSLVCFVFVVFSFFFFTF